MSTSLPLAITTGEPAGIGPDLCLTLTAGLTDRPLVLLGDRDLLASRARQLGLSFDLPDYDPASCVPVSIMHHPLAAPCRTGQLDVAYARYVLSLLDSAIDGCMAGGGARFAGMVTAPVHKGIICDAGIPFTGHTEYLAEKTGTPRVVMMLVGGGMRVALATTHLPLKDVADALTIESLTDTIRILEQDLRLRFKSPRPRILIAGLNPHAGEGGHLGREEGAVIEPVLAALRQEGFDLQGPLPADTLFQKKYLEQADAVLAMYHDQGLPVLKYASFGEGVNVTLGLPLVRTSVDHGTALDLAGTGRADAGSLRAAVKLAAELAA